MNKIIFCQFSNSLLNKDSESIADRYYNQVWIEKEKEGYWKSEHFWEIPLWITEISGSLKDSLIEKELYIIENIEKAKQYLNNQDYNNTKICFSVLDINKHYVKEIISNCQWHEFLIGGYIDFTYFNRYFNVRIFNSIKSLIEYLGLSYEYNLDYSLFSGYKTIPRLTLSYGCLNRCKFCTVEKTIKEVSENDIFMQIESFKCLKFKLIYLNDKTFGQANNYNILPELYEYIKSYNSEFKGFIIQTTVSQISIHNLDSLIQSGIIFAIELGIETFNDDLLYNLDKPQTEKSIIYAMNFLRNCPIKIISNIIIGIIGENIQTYNKTLTFLKKYANNIYMLNIYNLAIYLDSPLSKEVNISNDKDLNENSIDKTFYSDKQLKDNECFYNEVFKLGLEVI